MSEPKKVEEKKRAGRSPSYPLIDIQTGLKRIRELYDKAQHHYSPVDIVAKHWGYNPGSGMATGSIAALIRYGLLVTEGSRKDRKVRLTDFALAIIKDKRSDSTERNQRIKEAAFRPKIHAEMYEMYGFQLVSDEDLLYELEINRHFTPNGAREFISQYKRTLEFVRELTDGESESSVDFDKSDPSENISARQEDTPASVDLLGEVDASSAPLHKEASVQTIKIPMLEGVWPTLTAQFPMAKEDWDYMMKVLKAMEPKLVKVESKFQEVDIDQEITST